MNVTIAREMLQCHFWATHQMLTALEDLNQEQYEQTIPSSFPSLQATIAHMIRSDEFLLASATEEEVNRSPPQELPTVAAARERWRVLEERWRTYADSLTEGELLRSRTVRFSSGREAPYLGWQILHQLVVHGPYHRGQVITLLHQVGGKRFKTDTWVFHRSAAEQS